MEAKKKLSGPVGKYMSAKRAIAFALACFAHSTYADVLANCGASQGRAYYPQSPLVSKEKSGWSEDRISKGSFQLVRSGDDYDIIFTDATGGTLSSKGDGGRVTATADEAGNLLVLIFYRGKSLESYVFWFSDKAERTVTFSQAKYGATVPKHSLMRATCDW